MHRLRGSRSLLVLSGLPISSKAQGLSCRDSDFEATGWLAYRGGIRQTPVDLHAFEWLFALLTRRALVTQGLDEGLPTERLTLHGLRTFAVPVARLAKTAVALDAFLAAAFLVLAALLMMIVF